MWRRAAVSIHVQLFALNHLVLRLPLMDSYTEWGSFRHSIKELSFVCSVMPSVSDPVAAPRLVRSGERPRWGVFVEGDLMGLGD